MRDDPYPARFYGRLMDEPVFTEMAAVLPGQNPANAIFQQPFPRVLLLLMTLYLCFAFFLIFAVTSYAAPLGNATLFPSHAAPCIETAAIAAH